MSDLVSRQSVIDALIEGFKRSPTIAIRAKDMIEQLPSDNTSETPNSSDTDTISRQAAIDALDKRFDSIPMKQTTEILLLRKDLRDLPSAQPDSNESSKTQKKLDTISRQAAIDELIAMREHIDARMSIIGCTAYEMAIEALREPEIIHCKDCAHYGGYGFCHEVDGLWHDEDYCSRAERRES